MKVRSKVLSKFTKAGSSVAVIIPSSDLKRLGIKAQNYKNYSFDLRVDEDKKIITLSDFKGYETSGDMLPPDDEIPF